MSKQVVLTLSLWHFSLKFIKWVEAKSSLKWVLEFFLGTCWGICLRPVNRYTQK